MIRSFLSVDAGYYRRVRCCGCLAEEVLRGANRIGLSSVVPLVGTGDATVVLALSDEALLAGMGSGDRAAAAAFVGRFERRVFGLTLSILRDRGAAEEAAQETFVRAWRHASTFDARRGNVAAWLLTIARNASINMLPSRRADPVEPDVLLSLAEARVAHDGMDTADDAESLRDAVRRLPEAQRRALVLAVFYGFTAREVSDLDGVPLGTVKTRIRAALTKLRAELGVGDGT